MTCDVVAPAGAVRPLCRHCGREVACRPRGLGFRCYHTPGVRSRYPISASKYAVRGVGNLTGPRPAPAAPCPHPPGSAGRVETLAGRAGRGEQLWHPADRTFGD